MLKQVNIYYRGRVQGVGFRFTALEVARSMHVNGWVKNLPDGRVEIVAEAEEDAINNFLAVVQNDFLQYIRDTEFKWQDKISGFKTFEIRY